MNRAVFDIIPDNINISKVSSPSNEHSVHGNSGGVY